MDGQAERDDKSIEQQYVDVAHDAIVEIGVDGISAREIGRRMGRSAPAVYWHFESMDFLIAVASVRFLKEYYDDLFDIAQENPNPLILNVMGWECLAYYAFSNVLVFENLFMGDSDMASKAVARYYELFPDELSRAKDYLYPAITTADLRSRDRMLLQQAADLEMISQDAVDYIVDCDLLVLGGLFRMYRSSYKEPGKAQEAVKRFLTIIARNLGNELLAGNETTAEFLKRYAQDGSPSNSKARY